MYVCMYACAVINFSHVFLLLFYGSVVFFFPLIVLFCSASSLLDLVLVFPLAASCIYLVASQLFFAYSLGIVAAILWVVVDVAGSPVGDR